jgi:hypothetical protein
MMEVAASRNRRAIVVFTEVKNDLISANMESRWEESDPPVLDPTIDYFLLSRRNSEAQS